MRAEIKGVKEGEMLERSRLTECLRLEEAASEGAREFSPVRLAPALLAGDSEHSESDESVDTIPEAAIS